MKVDKNATKATGGTFTYLFKVKGADDATAKLFCTVDRSTDTVSSIVAGK